MTSKSTSAAIPQRGTERAETRGFFGEIPIAVVGMACRLPGADDLDEYWKLIVEGRSAVGPMPASRLNRDLYFERDSDRLGKTYSDLAALMKVRPVPKTCFGLGTSEIAKADRVHLELCHVVADAFRHAGIDPSTTRGTRAGVYMGHTRGTSANSDVILRILAKLGLGNLRDIQEFQEVAGAAAEDWISEMVAEMRARLPDGSPHTKAHDAAHLVSRAFGLDGPSFALNAACSSTLAGLAFASHALQLGQIDAAVVGGASYAKLESLILFSKAQSVSGTGSRPFDDSADGLILGEGNVACVLKTLDRALSDGDTIHAVIRGIGISSDGKGKSLWAPRKEGQIEAMLRAYQGDVTPESIQYLEAHATSTPVGDSTELNAASAVLASRVPQGHKIPVGSSKANIGHVLEPAGMAGLFKAILAMKQQIIPPVLNVECPNRKIDWDNSPLFIPHEALSWNLPAEAKVRRAGVNSFGVGGLNAHVVIDEFLPSTAVQVRGAGVPRPITLNPDARSLAIIGSGVLAPGARTIEALEELFDSGRDARIPIPVDRWDPKLIEEEDASRWIGGFIEDYQYDWKKHRIPPKQIAHADPLQYMVLDAVDQALTSAGYDPARFDAKRTGVLVGNVVGGEFSSLMPLTLRLPEIQWLIAEQLSKRGIPAERIERIAAQFEEAIRTKYSGLQDDTGSFTNSSLASRITKQFNLMGGACAIDSGDSSAMMALDTARNLLLTQTCDMIICAAGQRSLGMVYYEDLRKLGLFGGAGSGATLDSPLSHLVPGEGVGVLLLKRLADARRDQDNILAIVREIGIAGSDDPATARRSAMSRAQTGSGDAVITHLEIASRLPTTDPHSVQSSLTQSPDATPPLVTQAASQIGHTGGASGMMSILRSLATLKKNSRTARSSSIHCEGNGLACHVLLESFPSSTQVAERIGSESFQELNFRVWMRAAASVSELLATAQAALDQEAFSETTNTVPLDTQCHFSVAIVGDSPERVRENIHFFLTYFESPQREKLFETRGIYFVCRRERPKIALLFPGQGSQSPEMLQELVATNPIAARIRQENDETLQSLDMPSYHDLVSTNAKLLGTDVFRTQLSLLVAGSILHGVLREMGIHGDVATGHSFGELTALHAAGVWDFRTAALATKYRCDSITEVQGIQGAMVSCQIDPQTAEKLSRGAKDIHVANINGPEQVIFAGPADAINEFTCQVQAQGIRCKQLAVPRPFHTPLMKSAQPAFRAGLERLTYRQGSIPVLSGVDFRTAGKGPAIIANLVDQLATPVNFVKQIRTLSDSGVNLFIEVGPGQILKRLTERILKDDEIPIISANQPGRSDQESLARVRAILLAAGAWQNPIADRSSRDAMACSLHLSSQRPPSHRSETPLSMIDSFDALSVAQTGDPHIVPVFSGDSYEMGKAHGVRFAQKIQTTLERYCELADRRNGRSLPSLEDAWQRLDRLFTAEAQREMRGVADGAGVQWESIVAHNLQAYSDIGQGCVQVCVPANAARNQDWVVAANEDLPLGLHLRDALQRCVQIRRPAGAIPHLLFSGVGHVAGINGINARGVGITSSMLLDLPRRAETSDGLLHGNLVVQILQQATSADEALAILRDTPKTGAWGVCVFDTVNAVSLHVEYDGNRIRHQAIQQPLFLTNHAMLLESVAPVARHSQVRLDRLNALYQTLEGSTLDATTAGSWMRDRYDMARQKVARFPTLNTIRRVDNQMSLVLAPNENKLWFTIGPYAERPEDEYFALDLNDLLTSNQSTGISPRRSSTGPQELANTIPAPCKEEVTLDSLIIPGDEFIQRSSNDNGEIPPHLTSTICNRFVLRLLEQDPLPHTSDLEKLRGGVLILGDNAVAETLAARLSTEGIRCVCLNPGLEVEETVARLDAEWTTGPLPHLFLLTEWNEGPAFDLQPEAWRTVRQTQVTNPYLLAQRWFTLLKKGELIASGSITGGTRMGGTFGLDRSLESPSGGFVCGLVKGLAIEQGLNSKWQFQANLVDFELDAQPEFIVTRLLDEYCHAAARNQEIGYAAGKRLRVCPVVEPREEKPSQAADVGRVWVITGGARGVTAEVARELGTRFGLRLHLVGSSPPPKVEPHWRDLDEKQTKALRAEIVKQAIERKEVPIQAWAKVEKALEIDRNLRSLQASGAQITYHQCDLSDARQVETMLVEIRRQDGPINGIIHGAGFEKAAEFHNKKPENVALTIGSKVDGAIHLLALTKNDPLKYFIAFSSISGRFGGRGQTDYCLANEMLAKLMMWHRQIRPEVRSVAIDWHSWDDVGMAVRAETRFAKEAWGDFRFMPSQEGVEHLLRELHLDCPEAETMVTDWNYCKRYYPDGILKSLVKSTVASPRESPPRDSNKRQFSQLPALGIHRQVLRMTAAGTDVPRRDIPPGDFLILGNGDESQALVRQLADRGRTAQMIDANDPEEARVAVRAALSDGLLPNLMILTGRDAAATSLETLAQWQARRERGILVPFVVCQEWFAAYEQAGRPAGSLLAAVRMGGDFGIQASPLAPEGGAITGLVKSLKLVAEGRQWSDLAIRVVDFEEHQSPDMVATCLLDELQRADDAVEIGYRAGIRLKPREVSIALTQVPDQSNIRPGMVCIALGGGRGITADSAFGLAKRYGLRMHLIGSTPSPDLPTSWKPISEPQRKQLKLRVSREAMATGKSPIQEWKRVSAQLEITEALQRYQAEGLEVTYHACDITQAGQLARIVESIRRKEGAIDGIIQGAGVKQISQFENKSIEFLRTIIGVKLDATFDLLQLLRHEPLAFVVGFGSIGGRYGLDYGADYALAADGMCKLLGWFRQRRPDVLVTSFHWHGWDGKGMMKRSSNAVKLDLMPIEEGVRHIQNELDLGAPESEILITDGTYLPRFRETIAQRRSTDPAHPAAKNPLFDRLERDGDNFVRGTLQADPVRDEFLNQHIFKDRPIFPMVGYAAACWRLAGEMTGTAGPVIVENLEVHQALKFFGEQPLEVKVEAKRTADGVECEVLSDFYNRAGKLMQKDRRHFSCVVPKRSNLEESASVSPPTSGYPDFSYPEDRSLLYHGPIYRQIRGVQWTGDRLWAKISVPEARAFFGKRSAGDVDFPAVLIDSCFVAAGVLLWFEDPKALALPVSIGRLTLFDHQKLGEFVFAQVRREESLADGATYNIDVRSTDGKEVLRLEGFRQAVVRGAQLSESPSQKTAVSQ